MYMDEERARRRYRMRLMIAMAVTMFCFLPLGVAAIIFSARSLTLLNRGDADGAYRADGRALWCIYGSVILWLAMVIWLLTRR